MEYDSIRERTKETLSPCHAVSFVSILLVIKVSQRFVLWFVTFSNNHTQYVITNEIKINK